MDWKTVQSEHDEFIKPEHADHLPRSIPGAELILLPGVSHFAPVQRPALFNRVMLEFLRRVFPERTEHPATALAARLARR